MNQTLNVRLIGPDPSSPGGIETVIATLLKNSNGNIKYSNLISWKSGTFFGVRPFLSTLWHVFLTKNKSDVTNHVHIGRRGSWFREGTIVWFSVLLRYKTVVTLHGSSLENSSKLFLRLVSQLIGFKHLRAIVVLSPRIYSRLNKHKNLSLHLLPNPIIEYSNKYYWSSDRKYQNIIFVGKLDKRKGIELLVNVWKEISRLNDKLCLQIIGPEGNCKISTNAEQYRIFYLGELDHETVLNYMANSLCLVLPSYQEQSPMVIWEAMNIGTPVIASRLYGIEFQLGESYPFLVKPKDEYDLKSKMELLINDKSQRKLASTLVLRESLKSNYKVLERKYISIYG